MSFLLFVGLVVLAVLLFDTRTRLKRLEDRLAERGPVEALPESPAAMPARIRIVDEPLVTAPPPPPPVMAEVALPSPLPEPEPVPFVAEPAPAPAQRSGGFEELFGGKLLIWAGGVTLAVAGVLLVKYSIDLGLLSPAVRVILGLLFGAGLIGGAEAALRGQARVQDPRVHQALSGAGVASLYAAILAAANLYHLVDGGLAFAGLAAVTALAMGLSLRFGVPSAVLGLAGGLAAPALVSAGPPNVPLLSAYLALAIGGLTALSRRQRWVWLGVGALVGGAGWSAVLILMGALNDASTLSLGLLILFLGLALPLLLADTKLLRVAGAFVAAVQIAAIVATGGFGALQWGLYLLVAAATVLLADRAPALRPLPPLGLAIGLLLAGFWPTTDMGSFTLVVALLGIIHGAGALRRLWQDGAILEASEIAAGAVFTWLVALAKFHDFDHRSTPFALLALGIAVIPMGAAALGWRKGGSRLAILAFGTGALLAGAVLTGLPSDYYAIAAALLLLAGAQAARAILGRALLPTLGLFALMTLLSGAEPLARWAQHALPSLAGPALLAGDLPKPVDALRLLGLPALLAGLALWRARPVMPPLVIRIGAWIVAAIGLVAAHSLYRQGVFGLATPEALLSHGLADRLLWEALLIGFGIAAWRRFASASTALIIAGLAHLLWYNAVLFNPLWRDVAVGPWPIANLLLPLYGIAFGAIWALERLVPAIPRRAVDIARMALTTLLAFSILRQFFAGSILNHVPVSEAENIGWSVLAIALAIGFLLWGVRRAALDWRIASLVLMLGAIGKVFLFDASGLTGLLRIASFLALGFSLIGVGWFYSRFLRTRTH